MFTNSWCKSWLIDLITLTVLLHHLQCGDYCFVVKAIETAPPEKRRKLLEETFSDRRPWIVHQGPGMIKTLKKFNVFVRFPEEVCILPGCS